MGPGKRQVTPMVKSRRPASLRRWIDIWGQYQDFRRPNISPSTYQRDYRKISDRLKALRAAAPHMGEAIQILNHLNSTYSAETTRRTMQQLNACGKWAVIQGIVKSNPWEGLQTQIRRPPPGRNAWAALTAKERDVIIAKFEADHPRLAPWVRFQFYTGARPEESAALTWTHVAKDFSWILFNQSRPGDTRIIQRTKSYKETRFPCNSRLADLLKSLAPTVIDRGGWVHRAKKGGNFDYINFQQRYWRPLINDLVDRGEVACYLPQYHSRHTWITLALDHLPPQDVSHLARVSVDVIYKHYVGRNREIVIPDF